MEAASKAGRVFGMVRWQFKEVDNESFLIIYKGFVSPRLGYAIQAWSSTAWKKFKEEQPRLHWRKGGNEKISSRHIKS